MSQGRCPLSIFGSRQSLIMITAIFDNVEATDLYLDAAAIRCLFMFTPTR